MNSFTPAFICFVTYLLIGNSYEYEYRVVGPFDTYFLRPHYMDDLLMRSEPMSMSEYEMKYVKGVIEARLAHLDRLQAEAEAKKNSGSDVESKIERRLHQEDASHADDLLQNFLKPSKRIRRNTKQQFHAGK